MACDPQPFGPRQSRPSIERRCAGGGGRTAGGNEVDEREVLAPLADGRREIALS
jgi:hypothetical protein